MAKRFEIEVEKVNGYCACGYKEGDIITCEGLNTPDQPFCGGAYAPNNVPMQILTIKSLVPILGIDLKLGFQVRGYSL